MSDDSKSDNKLGKWLVSRHLDARTLLVDLIMAFGIATFGIALILYAYLGIFSRYYADDFCLTSSSSSCM